MISLASLPILADGPTNHEAMRSFALQAVHEVIGRFSIPEYAAVCDDSNNSPARQHSGQLWIDVSLRVKSDTSFEYIPLCLRQTGTYMDFLRDLAQHMCNLDSVLRDNP